MKPAMKVTLIPFLIFLGCAFKEPEKPTEEGLMSVKHLSGDVFALQASWEESDLQILIPEKELSRHEKKAWLRARPITLPRNPKARLKISLNLSETPEKLGDVEVTGEATSGENLEIRLLGIEKLEVTALSHGSAVTFEVVDVSTLFSQKKEQRVYLTLHLKSKWLGNLRTTLALSTPPSRVTVIERKRVFGLPEDSELPMPSILDSQSETRVLLEYWTLRNDSFDRIRIEPPFRTDTKLKLPRTRYWTELVPQSNPHFDMTEQRTTEEVLDFQSELYFFPSDPDLKKTWTSYSQKQLSLIEIQPGETVTLGLYLRGESVMALQENPPSKPQLVASSTGVQASCPSDRLHPFVRSPIADMKAFCASAPYNRQFKWPRELATICLPAINALKDCYAGNHVACNTAALLDDKFDALRARHPDHGMKWAMYLGCRKIDKGTRPSWTISPGWDWTTLYSDLLVGYKTNAALISSESPITMRLRFETSNSSADQEYREVPIVAFPYVLRSGEE